MVIFRVRIRVRIRIRVRVGVRVRVRLGIGLGLGFSSGQSQCVPPFRSVNYHILVKSGTRRSRSVPPFRKLYQPTKCALYINAGIHNELDYFIVL